MKVWYNFTLPSSQILSSKNTVLLNLFCCIFQPAFGVLHTPNPGQIMHFQYFFCKKAKKLRKSKKIVANFCKKTVFFSVHQGPG